MDDVLDKIADESLERVEITNEKKVEIISFEDLINKLDYQFSPIAEFGIDNVDYMKWFATKILNMPEMQFPANVSLYINEDNLDEYKNFINQVKYNFRSILGIRFNDDENEFENIYYIYYYLIVKPEEFITDYLLDYHFYKTGYDFKDFYKNKIISNNIPNFDITKINPTEMINNIKMHLSGSSPTSLYTMDYKYKFSMFMYYAKSIFGDINEFKFYDIFKYANEYAPCDTYENLDDQINIFNNISYEDEELITDYIFKVILNETNREVYITKNIIDPFFVKIRDFEMSMAQSIQY